MKSLNAIKKEIEETKPYRINDSIKNIRYYELEALLKQTEEIIEIIKSKKIFDDIDEGQIQDWNNSLNEIISAIIGEEEK